MEIAEGFAVLLALGERRLADADELAEGG
jgi:hypothetical protein